MTYVLHWPSMDIENGEFVGDDADWMDDPVTRSVVFVGGGLAGLLSPLLLLAASIGGTELVAGTVGLGVFGGSSLNAVLAFAFAFAAIDVLIQRIVFSPLKNISGILALTVVLPVFLLFLWVRRDSTQFSDPEKLAKLAGENAAVLVIASQKITQLRPAY